MLPKVREEDFKTRYNCILFLQSEAETTFSSACHFWCFCTITLSSIIQMRTIIYTDYLFYLTADYITSYCWQKQELVKIKPYTVINVPNVIPPFRMLPYAGHTKQAFASILKTSTIPMVASPFILHLHIPLKTTPVSQIKMILHKFKFCKRLYIFMV